MCNLLKSLLKITISNYFFFYRTGLIGPEIQMLLKQMIDYQGLTETPPETIMNIHFFDNLLLDEKKHIPFVKNDDLTLVSDNELIKTFCSKSFLSHRSLQHFNDVKTNECVLIAFDNEKETYGGVIKHWLDTQNYQSSQIICQDDLATG